MLFISHWEVFRMKKLWSMLGIMLLIASAGFSNGINENTTKNASSTEPVKLSMLFSAGGSGKTFVASAQKFGEEYKVEMEALTFPLSEVYQKQILALSSKQDTPDVISIDDNWIPVLAPYLEELHLSSNITEGIVPSMLQSFNYQGKQYGVPTRIGGETIIYRKDLFEKYHIDPLQLKTWEDVYQAGKTIKEKEKIDGWVGGYAENANIMQIWLNIMAGYGASIFNAQYTDFVFDSPEGIAATEMFVKLTRDLGSKGILNYGYSDEIEALQTGAAGMGQLWSSRFASVNKAGLTYSGQFGILPFSPSGKKGMENVPDIVNGWGFGINKYSKHKKEAQEFLEFIASYDEQLRLATEFSNSPTVTKVYTAPAYLKAVPVADDIAKAMEHGIARPQQVKWSELEAVLALNLQKAVLGEVSAEDALKKAKIDCKKVLDN